MQDRVKLGVVMDPIQHIHPEKDTSLALLLEAQERDFELFYLEPKDLSLHYGIAWGNTRPLTVHDDLNDWYSLDSPIAQPLDQLNVILMRVDPPISLNYFYLTYILEHAEQNGVLVMNSPQGLREANEKLFATHFPQCMPPTLVSCSIPSIKTFIEEHETTIIKPLDGMGGDRIFKCHYADPNLTSLLEVLTEHQTQMIMTQQYIPAVQEGDKRIFLLDGEPLPYALSRIPPADDFRANLAIGGRSVGAELTDRDIWICEQIGPTLRKKGLRFVGIDVIGEYLTEINVTSPTCIRETEKAFNVNLCTEIVDYILETLER